MPSRLHLGARSSFPLGGWPAAGHGTAEGVRLPRDVTARADRVLLARYGPPGVIVDEKLNVLQFRGRTGPYLEQAPGQPQHDLLKMARVGLLPALRAALASDAGRTMREVHLELPGVDLDRITATAITSHSPETLEVADRNGRWQRLEVRPYLGAEGKAAGAVSLFDIDLKRAVDAAVWARDFAAGSSRRCRCRSSCSTPR